MIETLTFNSHVVSILASESSDYHLAILFSTGHRILSRIGRRICGTVVTFDEPYLTLEFVGIQYPINTKELDNMGSDLNGNSKNLIYDMSGSYQKKILSCHHIPDSNLLLYNSSGENRNILYLVSPINLLTNLSLGSDNFDCYVPFNIPGILPILPDEKKLHQVADFKSLYGCNPNYAGLETADRFLHES